MQDRGLNRLGKDGDGGDGWHNCAWWDGEGREDGGGTVGAQAARPGGVDCGIMLRCKLSQQSRCIWNMLTALVWLLPGLLRRGRLWLVVIVNTAPNILGNLWLKNSSNTRYSFFFGCANELVEDLRFSVA